MEISDSYFEISSEGQSLFKDKGSKHFGYAFCVYNKTEVETKLEELRKKHHASRHICYAYSLGVDSVSTKYTDDGEPHNSAGPPILGQIQSANLSNTLVAVVRYFGGTKLGVGGLINAYKTAAKMAIENASITERHKTKKLTIQFPYTIMSEVMRTCKQDGIKILHQNFVESCELELEIRESIFSGIFEKFSKLHLLNIV